jgi:FixJ family two-component response regulator
VGVRDAWIISIVDDDESNREALRSLLRSVGFTAEAFASAEGFLNSDHLHHTGCLILDLGLPGMTGLELQQHLAAAKHRIPIIFITAYDDEAARARAFQAGAVGFLQKPFRDEALLHAVQVALRRGSQGDPP